MRILIIEDEKKVADAMGEGLGQHGFEALTAATGEEGFFLLEEHSFDAVILDLQLPGRDGLQILSTIRRRREHLPVLIVTARDTVPDRVAGLDAGADDYLVKPFAFVELLARLRSVIRRGGSQPVTRLSLDDLTMDLVERTVERAGEPVALTSREFDLLSYLLRNKGDGVTREMLACDVWKEPLRATSLDNVIDVHIARLRKKIDEPSSTKLIHTVRGVGFVMKMGRR